MSLVVLTGASGAGKTAIAEAVAASAAGRVDVYHFDSLGVPSVETMIADHGSPEAWQRAMTIAWLGRIAAAVKAGKNVLFEGQMRPSFLAESAIAAGLTYRAVLVDCDDLTRARRLAVGRGQAELANAEMMSWAAYLRGEAATFDVDVLDTSQLSIADIVVTVMACFRD